MQIRSKRTLGWAISEGEDEHSTEVILMPFEVLGSKNLPQLRKFTDRSGLNISVRTDEQAVIIASWRTLVWVKHLANHCYSSHTLPLCGSLVTAQITTSIPSSPLLTLSCGMTAIPPYWRPTHGLWPSKLIGSRHFYSRGSWSWLVSLSAANFTAMGMCRCQLKDRKSWSTLSPLTATALPPFVDSSERSDRASDRMADELTHYARNTN